MSNALDSLRPDLDGFISTAWPLDLDGWGSSAPIFERLIARIRPRLIIEVGVWKGASAIHMAGICAELRLACPIVCVDTWLGSYEFIGAGPGQQRDLRPIYGYPHIYYQFLANVVQCGHVDRIIPFPQTSLTALRWLYHNGVRADLIYLDGSHDARDVSADIQAALPVLSDRGVLFGDDYDCWPAVRQAVEAAVGAYSNTPLHVEDGRYWVLR